MRLATLAGVSVTDVTIEPASMGRSRHRTLGGTTTVDLRVLRAVGAALAGLAAVLTPIPAGLVPPCPLRTLTGIPCPTCGMTRGFAALVHGDVEHALMMNPGTYLVVAVALFLLVQWRAKSITIPVWTIVAMLAAMWTWQLFKLTTGQPL